MLWITKARGFHEKGSIHVPRSPAPPGLIENLVSCRIWFENLVSYFTVSSSYSLVKLRKAPPLEGEARRRLAETR